jgi:hypothetical protein
VRGKGTERGIQKLRKVLLDFHWSIKKEELQFGQIKGGARGFTEIG